MKTVITWTYVRTANVHFHLIDSKPKAHDVPSYMHLYGQHEMTGIGTIHL